jgi:selenocysteine-specific elongation factor
VIIGTAGHIDHGKSALVEALTGAAMDPLAEERRRGITLDLHFAPLILGELVAGVIDVPGHEDLIRTMVAGAAGLDLVLLIVSADEGIMPQTREHLAIVEQLRVPAGIPVLTKSDLVEPEWLALVENEITSWLAGSPVSFTAPVITSATRREGLEALRAAIVAQAGRSRSRSPNDLFRLPVDRALSFAGIGTVLTGTAWSGQLAIGDAVRLLPGGDAGRVRSLEHHGAAVEVSTPGARTAVGLAGIDRTDVRRGDVLVRQGDPWQETSAIDVALDLLDGAARPLTHHTRVRLNLGTDEVMARVSVAEPVKPGGTGLARLSLERPLVARGGDRFVLRSYSPVTTIGGGWVLDPLPPRGKPVWPADIAEPEPSARLRALVERRATGADLSAVPVLLGIAPGEVQDAVGKSGLLLAGGRLVTPQAVESASQRALVLLDEYHAAHPADRGMPLETLRQSLKRWGGAGELALERLAAASKVAIEGGVIRSAGFRPAPAASDLLIEKLVRRLEAAGLTPPTTRELETELGTSGIAEALRAAAKAGKVEAVERDRFFSTTSLEAFRLQVIQLGAAGAVTPQALRDATGLSRKFLIPLLEWCDRSGVTIRDGDTRQLTPRARAGVTSA